MQFGSGSDQNLDPDKDHLLYPYDNRVALITNSWAFVISERKPDHTVASLCLVIAVELTSGTTGPLINQSINRKLQQFLRAMFSSHFQPFLYKVMRQPEV